MRTANSGPAIVYNNWTLKRTRVLTDSLDQSFIIQIIGVPLLSDLSPANYVLEL